MKERYTRCARHDCQIYVFEFTSEIGGLDVPIIDAICPVCWVEEHYHNVWVKDFIPSAENHAGLVFTNGLVLYVGRPHGKDQDNRLFQYFDRDVLLDDLSTTYLESVRYLPGDKDTAPFMRLDFADQLFGKHILWALVDVAVVGQQIKERLLDEYIPD